MSSIIVVGKRFKNPQQRTGWAQLADVSLKRIATVWKMEVVFFVTFRDTDFRLKVDTKKGRYLLEGICLFSV
jgi:hypothetical protein